MFHRSVVAWVIGLCKGLRLSQSKAFAELVFGAMRTRRISLADIDRSMATDALAKSRIKRVDRFLGNRRVRVAEGMRALVKLAAKAAGWRLVVAAGLDYIVRVCGKVVFESERYSGLLRDLELYPGERLDLGLGLYRQKNPVRRRVVAHWGRRHVESWLLGTNLRWGVKRLVRVFSQRMMIEELFRDEKNIRYGWGLRQMRLGSAQRLERMFLVLALAYILLLLMGLICKESMSAAHWSSTTSRKKPVSAFMVGRIMQEQKRFRLRELLDLLRSLLQTIAEVNWG